MKYYIASSYDSNIKIKNIEKIEKETEKRIEKTDEKTKELDIYRLRKQKI